MLLSLQDFRRQGLKCEDTLLNRSAQVGMCAKDRYCLGPGLLDLFVSYVLIVKRLGSCLVRREEFECE